MSTLADLRSATRDAHERLENRLGMVERCRAPASYAALLAGMRSVYAPLERALAASPATPRAIPDWPRRVKTAWLDEDLAGLGSGPVRDRTAPAMTGPEDVVGCAYVMEGATLGAAIILRELRTQPVVPPHRFFLGYADERGPMWVAFRDQVDALDAGRGRSRRLDTAAVVAAALRTFEALEHACLLGTA